MHFLSARNRSEFLATPQLIRWEFAEGCDRFEPTLLIKGSTLLLKYIVQDVPMQLIFTRVDDRLLYALRVCDDEEKAGLIWSVLEEENEKQAIRALVEEKSCQTFLFNEIAVNVAWSEFSISIPPGLENLVDGAATGTVDYPTFKERALPILDSLHTPQASGGDHLILNIPPVANWHPIKNHFITSHGGRSLIDLFSTDEGAHQEQLAVWLTDSLHPRGVHHSPQIPKGNGFRELTDVLISYEHGSFLLESKALAIFARSNLPNRSKLSRDVSADITKAVAQLRGGMRRLKDGAPVTSKSGAPLEVERTEPMHGMVLIPDLDLVEDRDAFGIPFMREFMEATGGFLHLLDVAELLRVVQAAEMIASHGKTTTPMMAFDYYLMERVEKSVANGSLCLEVLLRIQDA